MNKQIKGKKGFVHPQNAHKIKQTVPFQKANKIQQSFIGILRQVWKANFILFSRQKDSNIIEDSIITFWKKQELYEQVKKDFLANTRKHRKQVKKMDQIEKERFIYYHSRKVFWKYESEIYKKNHEYNQNMSTEVLMYMIYTEILRQQFDCIRMKQIANDYLKNVEYSQHKAGSILLNKDRTKFVMFKNWRGLWSPPKGSIEKYEFYQNKEIQTAKEETWDEVGYSISSQLKENYFLDIPYSRKINVRYYIIENVDENYKFEEKQEYRENYNQTASEYWHDIKSLSITTDDPNDKMTNHSVFVSKYLKTLHHRNFSTRDYTSLSDERLYQLYPECKR